MDLRIEEFIGGLDAGWIQHYFRRQLTRIGTARFCEEHHLWPSRNHKLYLEGRLSIVQIFNGEDEEIGPFEADDGRTYHMVRGERREGLPLRPGPRTFPMTFGQQYPSPPPTQMHDGDTPSEELAESEELEEDEREVSSRIHRNSSVHRHFIEVEEETMRNQNL